MSDNALVLPSMPIGNALDPSVAPTADPFDYTDRYNTKLTPSEEAAYQAWAAKQGRQADTYDYDMRGAWKSGASAGDDPRGHYPDTYKKPNHPTFSDQSQYHGVDGMQGGTWGGTDAAPTFTPSATNLAMMSPAQLQRYFQQVEPDATLILPQRTAQ
jgi:hypothetical protein